MSDTGTFDDIAIPLTCGVLYSNFSRLFTSAFDPSMNVSLIPSTLFALTLSTLFLLFAPFSLPYPVCCLCSFTISHTLIIVYIGRQLYGDNIQLPPFIPGTPW